MLKVRHMMGSFGSMRRGMASAPIKAVVFDMGGVICPHPNLAWRQYEERHGLKKDSILQFLIGDEMRSRFKDLETGKTTIPEFESVFSEAYLQKEGLGPRGPLRFLSELPDQLVYVPEMTEAVASLKAAGLKLALLTNNFWLDEGRQRSAVPEDMRAFDVVLESCRLGLRKPDPAIYEAVLEKLGTRPEETAFLDDLGHNLKSAKALGIHTIKVEKPGKAVTELEALTGLTLNRKVPGTGSVRSDMQIPLHNLLRYLERELGMGSDGEIVTFRQFKHGQSNPTYYLQIGEKKMVLRKKPPGKLLPSAHQVEREYRVMEAVGGQGVPVPKLYHLCEDSSVIGTPWYLMDYVEGRIFKDPRLSDLAPRQRREIYTSLTNILAKIHSVDLEKAGLLDYGKHENYLERQLKRWSGQYEKSKTEEMPAMDKLTAWLENNLPPPSKTTLVHGDFRYAN